MSLPLPTPSNCYDGKYFFTADQLREYGQACREAALEEAAQACHGEEWLHFDKASIKDVAHNAACSDCAKAIRKLI